MTKRSSHNISPSNLQDIRECYTEILSYCLKDFAYRETQKISEKYNVDFEVVVAIACEWKRVEEFIQSENRGSA